MRAGQLRHMVTVQEKTRVSDGMGAATETWSTFADVWAGIWPITAGEQIDNQQIEHQLTHRVQIRYLADLKSSMRVLFGSRILEIVSIINPDERNQRLDLLCTEVCT